MKKILRILGFLVLAIAILFAAGAAFIHFRGVPTYEAKSVPVNIVADSIHLARGEHLVALICADCHRGEGNKLSGKHMVDVPAMFGFVHSGNITRDKKYGAGRYTDGELMHFLRTGIKRDGSYSYVMTGFPRLSDEDLKSIVAYLRSDAPQLDPVSKPNPPCEPTFFTKFLTNTVFKPFPYPEKPIVAPPVTDKVAYGRYLVHGGVDCFNCHSANFSTNNAFEPEKSKGYLAGGNILIDPTDLREIPSANLTPHPTHGIGKWTEEEFAEAVRYGKRRGGGVLSAAMPKFTVMTDEEISAIYAFLRTVPAAGNAVARVK
jgi:mono/diheme cytochrome c family protein